jgi:hypothetical protein
MAKLTSDYNLAVIYPEIAKHWHPTKNGSLTPHAVAPSSNKRIWWFCQKGHEWQAVVNKRRRGNGCPYCARQRANKNSQIKNPAFPENVLRSEMAT